uniref:Uncharacterized protein n=1 Tax=Cannabis sativa TaxID=3483 RepID=A0A803QPK0_CANSA
MKRVPTLPLSFQIPEPMPGTIENDELAKKMVHNRGQSQDSKEIKDAIVRDLAKILTKAAKEDHLLEHNNFVDWEDMTLFAHGEPYRVAHLTVAPTCTLLVIRCCMVSTSLAKVGGPKGKGKSKAKAYRSCKPRLPSTSSTYNIQAIPPPVKAATQASGSKAPVGVDKTPTAFREASKELFRPVTSLPWIPFVGLKFPLRLTHLNHTIQKEMEVQNLLKSDEREKSVLQKRPDSLSTVKRVEISEGLCTTILVGPIIDIQALEKHLVLKVGREVAPFAEEILDQVAGSATNLSSEKWETCSRNNVFALTNATKQQTIGMGLTTKRANKEVGALIVELEQANAKSQQFYNDNKTLLPKLEEAKSQTGVEVNKAKKEVEEKIKQLDTKCKDKIKLADKEASAKYWKLYVEHKAQVE